MTLLNPYLHDMLWSLCSSLDADVWDNSIYTHATMLINAKIQNSTKLCTTLKQAKSTKVGKNCSKDAPEWEQKYSHLLNRKLCRCRETTRCATITKDCT